MKVSSSVTQDNNSLMKHTQLIQSHIENSVKLFGALSKELPWNESKQLHCSRQSYTAAYIYSSGGFEYFVKSRLLKTTIA